MFAQDKFHFLVIFALQEFQMGVPKKRELFGEKEKGMECLL